MTSNPEPPILSRGDGSLVYTQDGRTLVDLSIGFGAAFLGHCHPAVTACLQEQAGRLLICGRNPTARKARVDALLAQILPPGLRSVGLYSTGMEVAEFAMRVAATHTGRHEFAGFARSMHGKSAMTAALCWPNSPVRPGNLHVLPFIADAEEGEILNALGQLLGAQRIAALFVEPIQGSNAAHEASIGFYQRAIDLCREHGTLCIFDETLTGLHRTGTTFYVDRLRETPDMLVFAKCMGNGFPVSTVALGEHVRVLPEALPGSTFAGNPMAHAAVEGTLTAMAALPMGERIASIESIVQSTLGSVQQAGVTLRGRGALWCLEFGDRIRFEMAHALIRDAGLVVTCFDRSIRLLPAATIEPQLLQDSCNKIAHACEMAGK
jgi:acetylornithine/LysW-gamma-L-lysine aminotransferase